MEKSSDGFVCVGKSIPRKDAYTKVTGTEKYTADYYESSFIWAGVKRASVPHGILKHIDVEGARKIPGVITVLTHKDITGINRTGVVRKDQPVLADERIRYCGEPIALVLAENRKALHQAIQHISIDYDALPGIFDVEEALSENALKIHEDNPEGNIVKVISVKTGKPEAAFDGCDIIVEGSFDVPFQEHAYLETETGWAFKDEDNVIVIVASTQTPFRDCFEIAPVLGVEMEKIRVIAPYLGGAFGGKDGITVQCLLGLAVLHAGGRPVKMWWDRKESFLAGVKRLSARMHYRIGATCNGELKALDCRLYYDGGAYTSFGGEIMTLGVEHAGSAYRIPNVSIEGWCVYTNNTLGGPFRGFGVPQATAAIEQVIDMLASKLGMDPCELRLKNAVRKGDKNCIGVTLTHSVGVVQCLETLKNHPLWKEKELWKKSSPADKIRGVGMVCMAHAMGYPPVVPDQATAKIEFTRRGRIRVYAGVVDMGQGNASTYLQIAGHILKQKQDIMELVLPDTARTTPCGSSTASRTTYTYGNALIGAARALGNHILEKAATTIFGSKTDEFVLEPGLVRHLPSGTEIALENISHHFDDSERIFTDYFRMPIVQEKLDTIYMGPHLIYSYGAHIAYVEIDKLTGTVEIKKYLAVTDAGRILNPQVFEQQIHGAVAQGIGYALTEEFKVVKGRVITENLATYIIPTSMDIPEIISIHVDMEEESGPFGMKGAGEVAMSGPLPAVANAVADGCGLRIFSAPITGEKVLNLLRKRDKRLKVGVYY